ncbi:MAG: DegT/DnrJ/EryC1/StrS family aminotransferase [Planctomycetes bacterium]|nr:DegT/DnrJ/EryC1/StrS family aminotransferase [Planctomycetota bacterium]
MISHSRPTLGPAEEEAVLGVLRRGYLSRGGEVAAFEEELARRVGAAQAVAVSSGHAALHLALLALGVGASDEVVIPTYNCAALLHAVRYVGATPVLVDVEADTYNVTVDAVRQALGPRTRAVIVPHMFGLPADVEGVRGLGVPVVEDCAMTLGTEAGGRRVGSLGDLAVFSFYATKLLTTGQGGAVAGSDRSLMGQVEDLVRYDNRDQYRVAYNYPLTDLGAALGRVQLSRLDGFIQRRRELAARYRRHLEDVALRLPGDDPSHVYFRFVVNIKRPIETVVRDLVACGVEAKAPVWRPLHLYEGLDRRQFPNTSYFHRCVLSLPIYPSLTDRECDAVVAALVSVL